LSPELDSPSRTTEGEPTPRDSGVTELPDTLKRSPAKAQRTYIEVHDNAVESYGEGERAHRTAMAVVKRSWEKVGDHWEPKDKPGPSDERAAGNREDARRQITHAAGGVDVLGHTKAELYERARKLGVRGRSSMTKEELGEAIAETQD
jgi:hypothetical protein